MAQHVLKTKADVVNEIRNQQYYNELEIVRLLGNQQDQNHKSVVDRVIDLLKANVVCDASIQLLEQYVPTPQKKAVDPVSTEVPAETVGVKEIE